MEQTKEYERLSMPIENIKLCISWLEAVVSVDLGLEKIYYLNTAIILDHASANTHFRISDNVIELIREDMKAVLKKHLAKLKKQRNALEV